MTISLYDASVGAYLQLLGGVSGFLERGLSYCEENGVDPEEIIEARLIPDMMPFRFQVQSVAYHSWGAVEGVKAGLFTPPAGLPDANYKGLQTLVAETRAKLEKLSPDEVNALGGKDVIFAFRDFKIPFTAENFLLSFSLPNFYFHVTTAYDILRMKGVPLGKRDFMGQTRVKS